MAARAEQSLLGGLLPLQNDALRVPSPALQDIPKGLLAKVPLPIERLPRPALNLLKKLPLLKDDQGRNQITHLGVSTHNPGREAAVQEIQILRFDSRVANLHGSC